MSRNKRKTYDPGDFRHKLLFYDESTTTNQYGSQKLSLILTEGIPPVGTWSKRDNIKDYNQFAIQAGATIGSEDKIFTIRFRKGFYPKKAMLIKDYRTGEWYNIAAVREIDDPCYYVEIVAIKKENYKAYITGDEIYYFAGDIVPTSLEGLNSVPYTSPFELSVPTTATVFGIIIKDGRSIESVIDEQSAFNPNITGLYSLQGAINSGDDIFNVYAMEVSVPYSSVRIHKFTLS